MGRAYSPRRLAPATWGCAPGWDGARRWRLHSRNQGRCSRLCVVESWADWLAGVREGAPFAKAKRRTSIAVAVSAANRRMRIAAAATAHRGTRAVAT